MRLVRLLGIYVPELDESLAFPSSMAIPPAFVVVAGVLAFSMFLVFRLIRSQKKRTAGISETKAAGSQNAS